MRDTHYLKSAIVVIFLMLGSMTNHKSFAQERFDTNCSDLEVQINYYNRNYSALISSLNLMM